jgi:hypothetical protein
MISLELLHEKTKHLPRVSTALVRRHTKLDWKMSEQVRDELREYREEKKTEK